MTDDPCCPKVPRNMQRPTARAVAIIAKLSECYSEVFQEKTGHDFVQEQIDLMWKNETTNGDELVEQLTNLEGKTKFEILPMILVSTIISCAYCVQAMKTEKAGSPDSAWTFITDATYWLGVILGAISQSDPAAHAKKLFSAMGKKGAAVRQAPTTALKEWVLKRYDEGNYPSANKAAHAIKDDAILYGRTIGAVLSEENAQRTIGEWIRSERPSR